MHLTRWKVKEIALTSVNQSRENRRSTIGALVDGEVWDVESDRSEAGDVILFDFCVVIKDCLGEQSYFESR